VSEREREHDYRLKLPQVQDLVVKQSDAYWSQQSVDRNVVLLAAGSKLYSREECTRIYAIIIFRPGYERRVSCRAAKLELN
jgi:hypothetical protein